MKSKNGLYFKYTHILMSIYIIGKILKECNKIYKYDLIKSNYPHKQNVKYYILWKEYRGHTYFSSYKFYESLDEMMVDEI